MSVTDGTSHYDVLGLPEDADERDVVRLQQTMAIGPTAHGTKGLGCSTHRGRPRKRCVEQRSVFRAALFFIWNQNSHRKSIC